MKYMKVEIRTVFHTALISFYQQLQVFSISRILHGKGSIFPKNLSTTSKF